MQYLCLDMIHELTGRMSLSQQVLFAVMKSGEKAYLHSLQSKARSVQEREREKEKEKV